tara:strand:+ start:425 stop:730 length:306 start_codon:yes stop_codon:yes gene_type:complete
MATYPVVNPQTGEQKEVVMSVHDWDQWKDDNPDWERDYSDPSTMPAMGVESVGDFQDKLAKKHPSWGEVLKKSQKAGGISARLASKGSYESSTQSAVSDPD